MSYYKLDLKKVKKALTGQRKQTETVLAFQSEVMKVVKDINKQQKAGVQKGLNLSDKYLNEKFGFSLTKSQKIRKKLYKEKIVIIPIKYGTEKKMRQSGPGTYPFIIPNKVYSVWVETSTEKKTSTPVEKAYKPVYCVKWHATIAEYKEFGLFEVAPIGYAMAIIHAEMNEWMLNKNLTRDDMRL